MGTREPRSDIEEVTPSPEDREVYEEIPRDERSRIEDNTSRPSWDRSRESLLIEAYENKVVAERAEAAGDTQRAIHYYKNERICLEAAAALSEDDE